MKKEDIHYVNVYNVDNTIVVAEDFGHAAEIYKTKYNTISIKNISCLSEDALILKQNVLQES